MLRHPSLFESQRSTGVGESRPMVADGFSRQSIRAHTGIPSIGAKMFTVHFFNSVQSFSDCFRWIWSSVFRAELSSKPSSERGSDTSSELRAHQISVRDSRR